MSLLAKPKSILSKIKSWSVKKKLIVSTIIFAIIAAGATTGLIIWQNSQNEDKVHYNPNKVVGKEYPDESHLLIKELSEIYHTNPLDWMWDKNGENQTDKISGLKDKTIENKINQEIAQIKKEINNLTRAFICSGFFYLQTICKCAHPKGFEPLTLSSVD